ncbi:MAG TPA: cytochrome c oxidase subunit 3 [Chitinophagales bacterium]|nr:cytochrome c oxidase subunit 3 [Chitinophagales bacterium]
MQIDYKNLYYPPGGILLWIIIFIELITFGIALIAMVYVSKQEPALFHESRLQLNTTFGTINTVFLLTSGFFMANSVHELKLNNLLKAKKYLMTTMLFGIFFLILKSIEYYLKIDAGLGMDANVFFTFYWMLTLFHLSHVIVGLIILAIILFGMRKENNTSVEDVEASAAFWHMCDLIWLLVFPVIYLIF